MIRLTDLLDRYGEAIAADLAYPAGWDVVELYEQGRWAFTLNLIDHLPRTSSYANALAQDEELAELRPDSAGRPEIPLTEWTPEREALVTVIERMGELISTLIGVNGGKKPKVPRELRPITAMDRVRARRKREEADALEAKLFPDQ